MVPLMWYKCLATSVRYERNALFRYDIRFLHHAKKFPRFTVNAIGFIRQTYEMDGKYRLRWDLRS
uniref:AlNc14C227G9238 protein n=1 Tax=Albugo laibachii Nc14 TaxID=890382 RepID=F0WS99_9STRA|nr:AlNc14C227G9238 [Albugo laibachii Nc14]CCA26940.1 AlNc14C433G11607 [Albugo laibachii Nc14]|eukprot:CCA26940.1 AlNc14C433G11607 [Albugo laibachii Nc14]